MGRIIGRAFNGTFFRDTNWPWDRMYDCHLLYEMKKPITPNSQIRSALRRLWLRSRERGAAVKRDKNTCGNCGRKGSVAKGREVKIEVHHHEQINWERIIEYIRRHLLVDPKGLECLCRECHAEETRIQKTSQ